MVKNPPANAGDIRDVDSILGWGRSPGGGHGNPLQYSCLENPIDRGAWWATVHRVAKGLTRLKCLSTHILWAWGGVKVSTFQEGNEGRRPCSSCWKNYMRIQSFPWSSERIFRTIWKNTGNWNTVLCRRPWSYRA